MKKYYLCVEWYNGPVSLYEIEAPADKSPSYIVNWLAKHLEQNANFNEEKDGITMLGSLEDVTKLTIND